MTGGRGLRNAGERDMIRWAQDHGWQTEGRNGMGHVVLRHVATGRRSTIPSTYGGRLRQNVMRRLERAASATPDAPPPAR